MMNDQYLNMLMICTLYIIFKCHKQISCIIARSSKYIKSEIALSLNF